MLKVEAICANFPCLTDFNMSFEMFFDNSLYGVEICSFVIFCCLANSFAFILAKAGAEK